MTDTTTATLSVTNRPGTSVYALKGKQGDRQMYLLLVTNNMLLRNFAAEPEVADPERVQRSLDKRHAGDIVDYIVDNPADYILGAMTYAIDNIDPNSRASVLSRGLVGNLGERVVVASPIYKHHFDLRSGECLEVPEHSVAAYPVRLEDGTVLVAV